MGRINSLIHYGSRPFVRRLGRGIREAYNTAFGRAGRVISAFGHSVSEYLRYAPFGGNTTPPNGRKKELYSLASRSLCIIREPPLFAYDLLCGNKGVKARTKYGVPVGTRARPKPRGNINDKALTKISGFG